MSEIPEYNQQPHREILAGDKHIASFIHSDAMNADDSTVKSFGDEWTKFNSFTDEELKSAGDEYLDIVTEEMLNNTSTVLDLGCGSGRWSYFIADRVKRIEAIDPSNSVIGASHLLSTKKNVRVTQAVVNAIPFADDTFDFLLCLGVLHHIPDTQQALNDAIKKVKPGGYALLYFYYNLENRGMLYRFIFMIVNAMRKLISSFPKWMKHASCDAIALFIYLPLVIFARMLKFLFPNSSYYEKIPLSYYINKNFRIMRNDALDRFGTPLEKRYSKADINKMCLNAGLKEVVFSADQPYWHCVGQKA